MKKKKKIFSIPKKKSENKKKSIRCKKREKKISKFFENKVAIKIFE